MRCRHCYNEIMLINGVWGLKTLGGWSTCPVSDYGHEPMPIPPRPDLAA